jgi:hypothetical protein
VYHKPTIHSRLFLFCNNSCTKDVIADGGYQGSLETKALQPGESVGHWSSGVHRRCKSIDLLSAFRVRLNFEKKVEGHDTQPEAIDGNLSLSFRSCQ